MRKAYKLSVIFLLLVVYCFSFQGARKLFDPDEGRYSIVALQMIESNDWLNPRTHPEHEHWTKPPLTYWAIAGSILTFGKNEFAVRFPNAVAFFLTIIISFFLGKVFLPTRPWVVSLIFATLLFPSTVCNGATTDYLLTMWEALAVCFFANAFFRKKDKTQLIFIWLMWVAFGFAFLTKGPPSLLPLFSIIIFLQFKAVKKHYFNLCWIRGLLIMMGIGGSWFFVVILNNHELMQYFLWDEVVLRVFSSHHERHSNWYAALYIFIPVLVFGTFPWCYYTGKGLIKSVKRLKKKDAAEHEDDNLKNLFLILWIIIPLGIFVIAKSRLPLYVLPIFVPIAIVTAREIERAKVSLYKIRYQIVLWCVFIVFVRLIMAAIDFKQDASKFATEIKRQYSYSGEEIVFVNSRPAFGLHFYIGAELEEVSLVFSEIEAQFKENKDHLWIILQSEQDLFLEEMALHNIAMLKIGDISARKNYVLFKRIADRINGHEINLINE